MSRWLTSDIVTVWFNFQTSHRLEDLLFLPVWLFSSGESITLHNLYLSMRRACKWRIYKRKLENCFQFDWINWELIDALETSFETFLHPSLLHFLSLFPHILLTNATLIEDLEMTSLWNHKCYWSSSSSSSGRVVKGLSIVVSQGYETRDHFLCVELFSIVTNNKWR